MVLLHLILEVLDSHFWLVTTPYFHIKLVCGANTNTRDELLAQWALLLFVVAIGLPTLHVFGDSLVIINWANSMAGIWALDHWCDCISQVKDSFLSLNFQHVCHEHNTSVDGLLKEALSLESGLLSFSEFLEGEFIGGEYLQLF